ncbi:hypothetical protein GALL_453690 [mine drainage metagenome]|uniref:Uncharacterized protein n=1 Tax=mine drainage metagenome TaxID=410659 RepID=A0A1J5QAK0_9ZZZZ
MGHDLLGRGGGATGNQIEGARGGFCFNHHDGYVVACNAAGHDHVEYGFFQLRVCWEGDPLVPNERNPDSADWSSERQASQLSRHRSCVDRNYVIKNVWVECHNCDDDLDLVAQPLDKGWAQWAVDQTAGENRIFAWTSFAAEE